MITDYREQAKELGVEQSEDRLIEHPQELVDKAFDFYNSKNYMEIR